MSSLKNIMNNLLFEQEEWTPIPTYQILDKYVDEFPSATIISKSISSINGLSLSGEKNSEYLTFQMNRYYDGIDFSDKLINICYKIDNEEIGGSNAPINVYMNNQEIKFGWLLPESITMKECKVDFIILIVGKEYEKDYILKTKSAKYSVLKGFECGQGITKPDDNWFEQFFIKAELFIKETAKDYVGNGNKDYNMLENKPTLNGVEISGNIELENLGIIFTTNEELDQILTI